VMAAVNARALGVPRLEIVAGEAPEALVGLAAPDAIFIGGGLSREVFEACWQALRPLGRLVANAVTVESETLLAALHREHGGQLSRLRVERAETPGTTPGWKPMRRVTQWSLVKR